MLNGKEMNIVYEMLSVFPLEEPVKLSIHVSRKVALFMVKTMELGILSKGEDPGLFSIADDGTMDELKKVSEDILAKSGLTNLNEKLKVLVK